jgi:cytochrome d ubiquinol oxidase subunit II
MNLENLWFCLIAVLWAGYFALEGFDFGVGMLLPFVPRDERERGAMFESIGPVWDGNEVWLVVAGGATFAAFPAWYATMFSGFYLALLLVLFFLIIRVVSFEWRAKGDSPRWRTTWQWANTIGSFGVLVFAYHGATYLTIRTTGDLCERAGRAARRLAILAVPVAAGFLAWTVVVAVDRNQRGASGPLVPALLGIGALVIALFVTAARRSGSAFAFTGAAVVLWVATVFTSLYPRVMVSSTGFANSLSVQSTASAHYTLAVMTVVAAIFVPLVLLYQGWTYHVFRARVGGGDLTGAAPTEPPPAVPGGSPAT